MSAHTPGPWTDESIDGSKWGVWSADGRLVAQAQQTGSKRADLYQVERSANARLIAAAPDLLESVIDLLHMAKLAGWEGDPLAVKARAAIAKATGESK